MTPLRVLLPAATLALSVLAGALPCHAAVFADFTPDTAASDFKWVRTTSPATGGALFSIASNSATSAQGVATHFSYLDPTLTALVFLPATFKLNAVVPLGNPAINNGGGLFTQTHVNGAFSFIYSGPTGLMASHLLVHNVTNLLSGIFTNAWMQGAGASGSANLSSGPGAATYTSDIELFAGLQPNTEEFAFNLLDARPGFGAAAGAALNSFRASGGGNFSFVGAPEPAAWLLMIAGFGGMGLAFRARRRTAIA